MKAPTQQQQQQASVAMRAARIPVTYQRPDTLDMWPEPESKETVAVREMLLRLDLNAAIHGATLRMFDHRQRHGTRLCYLLARGMVLRGIGVRCYALPILAENIEKDRKAFIEQELDGVQTLVILGFQEPEMSKKCPYDDRLRHSLEWFLTSWLEHGKTLVLHFGWPVTDHQSNWWSPRLIELTEVQTILDATL